MNMDKYGNDLKAAFGVSRQAAEIRLMRLGYGILRGRYHHRRLGTGERSFALLERLQGKDL
jgi:hypothetical protein